MADEIKQQIQQRIQFVRITLSDGRVRTFGGPEFVKETDTRLTVTNIQFLESQPLPSDMHFGPMTDEKPDRTRLEGDTKQS